MTIERPTVRRTNYRITTKHPTGYLDGEHEVTVSTGRHGKSVSGGGFGCSRDYLTDSDRVAVMNLLAENGMRLVKMVKLEKGR